MNNIVQGWQCPICKKVYSPLISHCTCNSEVAEIDDVYDAHWLIWAGWVGNHDKRIEVAECNKCGYVHDTVFGSTEQLPKNCPRCSRKMGVIEK